MDNKKWFTSVMIPNIAMAMIGVFFTILCYGALGWLMHWEPSAQNIRYIIAGAVGIAVSLLPIVLQVSGRQLLARFFQQKGIIQIIIIEIILWFFALLKRDEPHAMTYMYDKSMWDYAMGVVTSLCALLATLSCVAGIFVGGFTFVSFIFQRTPKQLWNDTTRRKRN